MKPFQACVDFSNVLALVSPFCHDVSCFTPTLGINRLITLPWYMCSTTYPPDAEQRRLPTEIAVVRLRYKESDEGDDRAEDM